MEYLLYGNCGSGSCTVELALAEIGAPFSLHDVSLEAQAQRGDDYASINPARKVPALITPDGETLTESLAILLTLDERHRESALLPPPGSPERARALRWLCFIASEIYPLVEFSDYPQRLAGDGDRDAVGENARALWRQRWLVLEAQIAGDPWLLESGFSVLDIYLAVVSRWTRQSAWRSRHLPRVEAIARALWARHACGPLWARHFD